MDKEKLISACKKKDEKVKEVEKLLEKAKDEYHQSIRDMHIEGMSYREIAQAINLSHQRVHQIVEAQESGWKRWFQKVNKKLACSFCKSNSEQVEFLVAGPNVYICDKCASICQKVVDSPKGSKTSKKHKYKKVSKDTKLRCSFCGKLPGQSREVAAGKKHHICRECLALTFKFMEENRTTKEA